jgi:2-dehydro-3-deoxygalactonokinase
MPDPALIAIDWGTTAARAYLVDRSGAIIDERSAPLGVQQVRGGAFAAALETLLGPWSIQRLPRIACGMVGSRQGWSEAPYVDCPASLESLAAGLARTPRNEVAIVPGIVCRDDAGIPDVMRGEETQLLGAVEAQEERVLAVLPGTHSKWVRLARGRIVTFQTYMTGETYSVMLAHSILGRMAGRAGDKPGLEFARGVARGLGSGSVLHHMFGARTRALLGDLAPDDVPDWLSGVLIGREIRDARTWAQHAGDDAGRVRVIGSDALSARYGAALAQAGIDATVAAPAAAARGLFRLAQRAHMID